MKRLILFCLLCAINGNEVVAQQLSGYKLLYTLTPRNGFFYGYNDMAFLDYKIQSFYPYDVRDTNGLVRMGYFDPADTMNQHVRLSCSGRGIQHFYAVFDVETTCLADTSIYHFSLLQESGEYTPLGNPIIIEGSSRQSMNVQFATNEMGAAQVRMYATRKTADKCYFVLRSISVYRAD